MVLWRDLWDKIYFLLIFKTNHIQNINIGKAKQIFIFPPQLKWLNFKFRSIIIQPASDWHQTGIRPASNRHQTGISTITSPNKVHQQNRNKTFPVVVSSKTRCSSGLSTTLSTRNENKIPKGQPIWKTKKKIFIYKKKLPAKNAAKRIKEKKNH